jgi:hypothetical protein
VGPTAVTTEVEVTVNGGPPGGATSRNGSSHHLVARSRWRPPKGVLPVGLAAATTKIGEIIDGAAPGGATGRTGSDHHLVARH